MMPRSTNRVVMEHVLTLLVRVGSIESVLVNTGVLTEADLNAMSREIIVPLPHLSNHARQRLLDQFTDRPLRVVGDTPDFPADK